MYFGTIVYWYLFNCPKNIVVMAQHELLDRSTNAKMCKLLRYKSLYGVKMLKSELNLLISDVINKNNTGNFFILFYSKIRNFNGFYR